MMILNGLTHSSMSEEWSCRTTSKNPIQTDMRNAAIEAMLETLDDPYTVWIPPAQEADFEKQMSGAYVGIGAEIAIENDRLKIITPLENSPSLQAGVRSGDVVLGN